MKKNTAKNIPIGIGSEYFTTEIAETYAPILIKAA